MRLEGEPAGAPPLPPYITEPLGDPSRYQTVYARESGSAAAPTAGLHFTPEVLARLDVERVTLHVGLDTFRPLQSERWRSTASTASDTRSRRGAWERIRAAPRGAGGGDDHRSRPGDARPRRAARRSHGALHHAGLRVPPRRPLLTNFHLPRSTLLALVMAFAGVEETRRLYELAIAERYRFYSFGDAMLIL